MFETPKTVVGHKFTPIKDSGGLLKVERHTPGHIALDWQRHYSKQVSLRIRLLARLDNPGAK